MKLLYPEFLYALFALLIPIVIHLFNFRKYKVVKFSQVKFLRDIQQQTQSTSRLKHWLVLLSRCLAIIALVLAFCQPYLFDKNKTAEKGKKGVSIFLDNSFSMQAKAEAGQLLDVAKNKALAIANSFKASDRYQLLTHDFTTSEQRWLNRDAFVDALQTVELSPKSRSLSQILSRQSGMYEEEDLIESRFMISDLQKHAFDWEKIQDSLQLQVIPIQAEESENVSLSALNFSKPYRSLEGEESLNFTVQNYSTSEKVQLPIQLRINGNLRAPMQLNATAEDTTNGKVNYRNDESDWQLGSLIVQDYPIKFDDSLYFAYPLLKEVSVLHLFEETANESLEKLFDSDSIINYQQEEISQANFGAFSNYQLIILDGISNLSSGLQAELKKHLNLGNSTALFPAEDELQSSVNDFLNNIGTDVYQNYNRKEQKVAELNAQAALYAGVFEESPKNIDLPLSRAAWNISKKSQTNLEMVLQFSNGDLALGAYPLEQGRIYLSALPLSDSASNFTRHAIFVPTLYNMALQAAQSNIPMHFFNEERILIAGTKTSESPLRLVGFGQDIIPKQRKDGQAVLIELNDKIKQAGHYQIFQGEEFVSWLALNYPRLESSTAYYTVAELVEESLNQALQIEVYEGSDASLGQQISDSFEGQALWKYFIVLALLFLALEILLLRILK